MSTLTYGERSFAPDLPEAEKTPRKSFWRRWGEALIEGRQRRADREIARYLARHGGVLTDDLEREIMRRVTGNDRKLV